MSDTPAPHPRRRLIWVALGIALVLFAVVGPWAAFEMAPKARKPGWSYPQGQLIWELAAIFAAGASLPLASIWVNRLNSTPMYRMTKGKAAVAVLMGFLWPIAAMGSMPIAAGFMAVIGFSGLLEGDFTTGIMSIAAGQIPIFFAAMLLYPFTSALIWGLSRWWRSGALVLFYFAGLSAVRLLGLQYSGGL